MGRGEEGRGRVGWGWRGGESGGKLEISMNGRRKYRDLWGEM